MIIVFGASGFIGTYLIDLLVECGLDVVLVDKDESAKVYWKAPFYNVDITNEKDFDKLPVDSIDAVVNVACLQPVNVSSASYKATDYIKVNVVGALNILEYCRKVRAKKLVYTISHRGVQGAWKRGEIIDEQTTKSLKYTGDYSMFSISECAAQDCIEHYAQQYGLKSIVLRLPPVYGYGPHLSGYTNGQPLKSGFMKFIENAIAGKPIELWGDADRERSIVYVKDVASAILLSIRSEEAYGLYNVAMASPVSLKGEAEAIIRVFAPNSPISFPHRYSMPNSVEVFRYDICRARKDLQWWPRFDLTEMVLDIKEEMESKRFEFLLEKRNRMLSSAQES